MNKFEIPNDPLYEQARKILLSNPGIGKNKLGALLGIKAPSSRLRIVRFRGETEGHSNHPDYIRVRGLKEEHLDWSFQRIANSLGISVDHARLHIARWYGAVTYEAGASNTPTPNRGESSSASAEIKDNELQDSVHDGLRDLSYRGTRIQTLEQLLEYAAVDRQLWEVDRFVINKYEIAAKMAEGLTTTTLFQIKAWLRRKVVESSLRNITADLLKAFADQAPTRSPIIHRHAGDGMLEIALFDLHYGKLAWGEECGIDYNPEIAEALFWNAIEDLLAKGAALKPAKIIFPVGNDFLHTDILGRTTTAGTPQDSAIVWKQAFVQGWQLLKQGIERLRTVAPVHVPVVNGNHDVMGTYHLGEVLRAAFSSTSDITIDNSPAQRKYVTHHKCLLGLTHGNEEKHSQLGLLMAMERPAEWALSNPSAREYHVGHLHHKRSLKLMPAVDVGGVLVRVIQSLTGLDSWHASKGFVSQRAAEAFYWDAEYGVTANFTHIPA